MSSLLSRAVDWGLVAVMIIAPLFMGGRHPVGELAYLVLVGFTAIAWFARQCLPGESSYLRTGIEFWLVCIFCLIAVQLMPLPPTLLSRVAPGVAELLPIWTDETGAAHHLGTWSTISLYPDATRGSLALFIAHAMLFVVVVQRLRSLSDVEWLLRCLAMAVVLMALVGLVQYFFGNGKFLGIYEHPFRDAGRVAKGSFINENHFAHFLALGVGPLIWWLAQFHESEAVQRRKPSGRDRRFAASRQPRTDKSVWQRCGGLILASALGIVVLAGVLSCSRGGIFVLLLSMLLCGGLLAWKTHLNKAAVVSFTAVLGLGLIGCVVVMVMVAYGLAPVSENLASLTEESLEALDQNSARRHLWQADLQAFEQFPAFGAGGGSHVEVYKTFYDHYSPVEYTHAESGFIQILTEYGAAGLLLLAFAIAVCALWCLRAISISDSTRHLACSAAVISGLTASVVHSVWDFVWYLPSCMSLVIVLAVCACRLSDLAIAESPSPANPERERVWFTVPRPIVASRLVWITATIVICAASVLTVHHQVGPAMAATHWERFLATAKMLGKHPEENQRESASRILVKHLENAVAADPNDARANLKLAANYIYRFEVLQQKALNPMPLAAIRDAVLASNFPTVESRDNWLSSAVGDNCELLKRSRYHARRSLQLCPLQGEGYVMLNELAFLGDGSTPTPQALLEQAAQVRPHSGTVLVAVGCEAAVKGHLEQALASWNRAIRVDPEQQLRLIEPLASEVTASFFLTELQLDLSGLKALYNRYRQLGRDDQAIVVGTRLGELLVAEARTRKGKHAAKLWLEGHALYKELGDQERSLFCALESVDAVPNDFASRRALAFELMRQDQFDQAIEQLQWCLHRKPNDAPLNAALKRAHERRLEQATAYLTENYPPDAQR